MPEDLFPDFLSSDDTLRIYEDDRLVFSSKKDRLLPLMDYLQGDGDGGRAVVIFDKIMGNAAALLAVKAGAREVFSPLGSDLAAGTLDAHGIGHHLSRTVPFILRDDGQNLCPMEQMSIGKTPDEFYLALRARIEAGRQSSA